MSYFLRRRQLRFALILKEELSHVLFAPGEAAPLTFDSQKKQVPLGLLQNTSWDQPQSTLRQAVCNDCGVIIFICIGNQQHCSDCKVLVSI